MVVFVDVKAITPLFWQLHNSNNMWVVNAYSPWRETWMVYITIQGTAYETLIIPLQFFDQCENYEITLFGKSLCTCVD